MTNLVILPKITGRNRGLNRRNNRSRSGFSSESLVFSWIPTLAIFMGVQRGCAPRRVTVVGTRHEKSPALFPPGLPMHFLRLRYFTRITLRSQPNFPGPNFHGRRMGLSAAKPITLHHLLLLPVTRLLGSFVLI